MIRQSNGRKWSRCLALFLTGTVLQFLPPGSFPEPSLAQAPAATPKACTEITAPLTPEEQVYARASWQYFVNNYQQTTGFVNSVGGYPSGTLWDQANYLMALNSARWLNITDQADFDFRLNKFLTSLNTLPLFEGTLPNKVYNTATAQMTDYGNNPKPRGIGWSALDIGRMLAALHIIRTCHPQYADWIKSIVSKWKLEQSLKNGQLYGATVLPDDKTLLVQEGRLGYEEYAARGYELWGFQPYTAIALEPFEFVKVNNLNIPADTRNYQSTNANNYVVSESYILDGIEFGLQGYLQDYALSVFEAQKRYYDTTGELTAVSEDNIDQPPYFLYNTVYSNGVPWAVITDENKPYPQLRTLSTKAAFGWRYLYPNDPYAQKIFDATKDLRSPDGGGFYAGLYQENKQPNKVLTGNTNGLILEILYYKARGNSPLISSNLVSFAPGQPTGNNLTAASPTSTPTATTPSPAASPTVAATPTPSAPNPTAAAPPRSVDSRVTPPPTTSTPSTTAATPSPAASPAVNTPTRPEATAVVVQPIPPVGSPQKSEVPALARPLNATERSYAQGAWNYFNANYQSNTGLVNDRSDVKGVTPWGIGDYLAALNAARSLGIISAEEFDQRTRLLLGALTKLPLFSNELPSRSYDTRTLQPIDYGGNLVAEGTGWSSLDIGRLLASLYSLKSSYPQYTDAVDQILLNWSYLRVVRAGRLSSAIATNDDQERQRGTNTSTRFTPETRLGYEEYAARAFQLWGFEVDRSAVGGDYQKVAVEGVQVPLRRIRADVKTDGNQFTVSNPFLLYGLEFGFDPQMRSLFEPIRRAEAERYRRTGKLTASATTVIDREPYVVHSTVIAGNEPWATLGDDGKSVPDARIVSTANAFAYQAMFPEDSYAQKLSQATASLFNPSQGYYEGFYEQTGKPTAAFTSSTNSIILQSLLYRVTNQQPVVRATPDTNSPWWRAVAAGDTAGRGLPITATQKARVIADVSGTYWASVSENPSGGNIARGTTPTAPSTAAETTVKPPQPTPTQTPVQEFVAPVASSSPRQETPPPRTTPLPTPPVQPPAQRIATSLPLVRRDTDRVASQLAWQYFERNWNPQTGLVNAADNYPVATLWSQGSALLGIHAARQLGVISQDRFSRAIAPMLQTLETKLSTKGLSNQGYSTSSGQAMRLDKPDLQVTSGSSAVDAARFLLALHVLRTQYPEYRDRINSIVARWNLPQLVKDNLSQGGIAGASGTQGYYQYAADSLRLWNIEAPNVQKNTSVAVAQSSASNSGFSNELANDPYLLWGLELGWPDYIKTQVLSLLKGQAQQSYFKYYSASTNDQPWLATNTSGKANPNLGFLSTKAAFAWESLLQGDPYAKTLRQYVQNLTEENRGYLSGLYQNSQPGRKASIDANTNAMILESLLYQARNGRPLVF